MSVKFDISGKKSVPIKSKILQYAKIVFGTMLTGIAVSVFFTPNKIVTGGVSGISIILFHQFKIPTALSFAVINIFLLAAALKFLGKNFVLKTLLGSVLLSIFVEIFSHVPPPTENILLSTIFGATLYGFGCGLALVEGSSTGGTDILGRLLQIISPQMKIGKLLLFIDAVVILISLMVFKNVELTLFGILGLFLSTYAIDFLIQRLNISKLAFVVTDFGDKIAEILVNTTNRGVTIIDAVGAYTMDNKKVLICALKENEILDFQRKILEIDEHSFIIFSESQQIVGNGFHVYK